MGLLKAVSLACLYSAQRFFRAVARHDAAGLLQQHDWPGNVRELQNLVRRLAASLPAGAITASDVRKHLAAGEPPPEEEPAELDARERQHILRVLEQTGGNKARAAEILGIQRRTLYKKLARIERERSGHTSMPETHEYPGAPARSEEHTSELQS